jgi:iron complex outermembrane recepter protein
MRDGAVFQARSTAASGPLLFILLAATAPPATAQEQQPPPATAEEDEDKAPAPEPPASAPDEQEIIVTGTRIPRPNLTAVSPVTVLDQQEAKLQGAILTEDLINSLPQAFADQGANLSNDATGTATVNLRHLGSGRTLVLIDGRRVLPGTPMHPAADINAVPAALIKRVEVLTGGASSVYGSDAVSGVVNFILDSGFEGFRFQGQNSFFQHRNDDGAGLRQALAARGYAIPRGTMIDGAAVDANAAAGLRFGGGRGHVSGYGGYRRLKAVTQARRDYSACATEAFVGSDVFGCGGSINAAPANFNTNFGPLRVGADRTFVPGTNIFNFAPFNYFQRPGTRYTAGAFARYEIGSALKPYLEAMFMEDRTTAQIAPSGSFGNIRSINCDNPLLSAQQRSLVCRTGNFIGETPIFDAQGNLIRVAGTPTPFIDPVSGATYFRGRLVVRRRSVEGGPRQATPKHRNLRLVGGVRGELGSGWSYDAYYQFGAVKFSDTHLNDFSITRLIRATDVVTGRDGQPVCRSALTGEDSDCVPWDVFALDSVSPGAVDYLRLAGSRRGTVEQRIASASITGDLGEYGIRSPWSDAGIGVSLGVEQRKETIEFRPDPVFATGDLAGQGRPDPPLEAGRFKVREAFVEARVPLVTRRIVDELSIEGGYRLSKYDNGASRFSTKAYKIGVALAPIRAVRIRASYNRAVRAPNIIELFSPQFLGGGATDPCAGPKPQATQAQCAFTGVTAAQYGQIIANPLGGGFGYNSLNGGNLRLAPEKAATKSVGVVVRPRFLPGFSATADWFDIDLKGAIASIGAANIMAYCLETTDPRFCDRIRRDELGSLWLTPDGFIDNTNMNIGAFRTRGVDFGVNYDTDIGRLGSLSGSLLGTWLRELLAHDGGQTTPYDCAGLYGFLCGVPNPTWRHKARLTWQTPLGVGLSLHWRHFANVRTANTSDHPLLTFPSSPRDAKIPAQNYFDLTATTRVRNSYELRLGVRNIFDREPPIISASGNLAVCSVPVCNGNTYPQVYDALGRYMFVGATVDF